MPPATVDVPLPEGPAIRIFTPYGGTATPVPSARNPTVMKWCSSLPSTLARSSAINSSMSSATPSPAFVMHHKGGEPANGRHGIGNCRSTFATLQKRVIIWASPMPTASWNERPSFRSAYSRPVAFIHAIGKHHHGFSIEDHNRQPRLLNRSNNRDVTHRECFGNSAVSAGMVCFSISSSHVFVFSSIMFSSLPAFCNVLKVL